MVEVGHDVEVEQPRIRVAAYVIRCRTLPELLVFDHVGMPEAGTQIPAGGVRPGEDLERAVLREVAEETGLLDVYVVNQIAVENRPHPLTHQPRRTTYFHLHASTATADAWIHQVDGDDHGLTFACRFSALPLNTRLADNQDAWLDQILS
ncbi:NUDIX domain-containing protein [Nocardia sp. NPDC057030]|uniref:NUDIX hydrolase n=1 Tax=unclassified Nocardia TaxID=2637762 RepID=UPI00362B0543